MGATVCAGGSQVCTGHSGTLMPRPVSSSAATTTWVVRVSPAPRPAASAERSAVPGGADEGQDAHEHQGRAEHGVEHEPAGRVAPGRRVRRVAEPADQHPHGHQDHLERHEEQDGVAGQERGERPELDQQQAAVERRAGPDGGRVRARVQHHRDAEDGGEHEQRRADAVDGEVPAHPERGDPRPVQDRSADHGDDHQDGGDHGDGQGVAVDEPVTARAPAPAGHDQGRAGDGRQQQGGQQRGYHRLTPTTPTASTPQRTQTRPCEGRRVCARSAPTPAQRVATTVPRT